MRRQRRCRGADCSISAKTARSRGSSRAPFAWSSLGRPASTGSTVRWSWAIDEEWQALYFFRASVRDSCLSQANDHAAEDMALWWSGRASRMIAHIEWVWFDRLRTRASTATNCRRMALGPWSDRDVGQPLARRADRDRAHPRFAGSAGSSRRRVADNALAPPATWPLGHQPPRQRHSPAQCPRWMGGCTLASVSAAQ